MSFDFCSLVNLDTVQLNDENKSWVHALPVGEYTHPVYGKMSFTQERIKNFADSVVNKIRGIDPSINEMHGINGGDGPAAGWVKDAKAEGNGLQVLVEWVPSAAQAIREKKWRYFSAEIRNEWTDPQGKTYKDVFFGGALTNRPYMKNLLPINLSEESVNSAIELAEIINKAKIKKTIDVNPSLQDPKEGGEDMDLKKFAKVLGLSEDSTEEVVFARLAEALTPVPKKDDKKTPEVPKVSVSAELKTLAEENPVIKALIETVDAQNTALREFQAGLLEADISKKLAEFDNSKVVLTPRAKDLVHDFLTDAPTMLHEKFWEILSLLRNNSGLMVELGERAGASVKYGRAKDDVTLFMDEANRVAQAEKISLDEAMSRVSREQPALWNGYRQGTYAFKE